MKCLNLKNYLEMMNRIGASEDDVQEVDQEKDLAGL